MRKLLLAAVAATAIASPAMARDGSPYLGIEGGALFARDLNFADSFSFDDGETSYDVDEAFGIDHKTGTDLDLIAGYDFGAFRAEVELGRKRAKSDNTYNVVVSDGVTTDTFTATDNGRTRVFSIMGNLLGDFGDENGLSFYGGAGIGYAKGKISADVPAVIADEIDLDRVSAKDSGLAWQLIAGLRYAVTPNVDVGLKYRYFRAKFNDDDAGIDTKFRSHSLLASLIFNFGAPAAPEVMAPPPPPPAPEPMPEPAPAPATQTCPDGTVITMDAVFTAPPPPPPPPAGERGL